MNDRVVLWHNVRIATCDRDAMLIESGALVTRGERIAWLGAFAALPEEYRQERIERHDAGNRWLTPALVDCHTHLVFAGNRAGEWSRLLNGASYEDIARSGGGIIATVKATRVASESELLEQAVPRLQCLLDEGVATVEIKSGYGLTLEQERKMLRVARQLAASLPVTVKTTFLAAHALPPEFAGRADDYIEAVAMQWLPTLHGEGLIDAVDVFCERIAFNVAQAERVLAAAVKLGLPVRMHAEQLSNMGATQLAARYGALSCDHLEHAVEADVIAMQRAGIVAVLLPTAFLHLNETQRPAIDALRKYDVPIAVASDCNPGSSPSPSLLLAAALGTRLFRLTPAEVLLGITRNAARVCGEGASRGTLQPGAIADFALWDVQALDEIPYWIGRNACSGVVRSGVVVKAR